MSLLFLEVFGGVHFLSTKFLKNHRVDYHKKLPKTFGFPEKFREGDLLVFLKVSGIENYAHWGYRVSLVFFHSAKDFSQGKLLCCLKFLLFNLFYAQQGLSQFCVENLLSHRTETFSRRDLFQCASK